MLPKTKIKDVRFLGIDIDAVQEQDQVICQFHIGISVLDTRSLHALTLGLPNAQPRVIDSHHFVVGEAEFRRGASRMFLFGQFETISLAKLKLKLEAIALHQNVVMVCHGNDKESRVLQKLNINFPCLYTLDTVKAAQYPLQLSYRYSLEKLLDGFSIPHLKLHSSWNDAHFVLRALLMIAVSDAELLSGTSAPPSWVPIFEEVARSLIVGPLKIQVAPEDDRVAGTT